MNIDATVLRQLKRRQRAEGKSLGELVSELLARAMAGEPTGRESAPLRWRARPMRARVDLEDKDALARALEDR